MYVEQLYTSCLSEAAYYIESDGVAAIIDPLRDTDTYVEMAQARKASIQFIFETHFHADFVSGHLDLSQATGAPIVYGPGAKTGYPIHEAKDGEVFHIGQCTLEVLHTPGHTMESSCYLLKDEQGKPHALFTGDTLFIGDVGRPDLMGGTHSKEELAGYLYDSLQQKIKPLADDIIVYPAHGPGSACGKHLGSETQSTIGQQKQLNYALQDMTKEEFIQAVTDGLSEPPKYFPMNARRNKEGYDSLKEVLSKSEKALSLSQFKAAVEGGALILDTRLPEDFEQGFVPGSINIGLNGRFAEWVGILLDDQQPIVLVTPDGMEEVSITRMARVGFDNVVGFLQYGFEYWQKAEEPIDLLISIDTEEFRLDYKHEPNARVLDVRREQEYEASHVENALNYPLHTLEQSLEALDPDQQYYVHCKSGYRSVIASSILKKHGFELVKNVWGGFDKIQEDGQIPIKRPEKVAG